MTTDINEQLPLYTPPFDWEVWWMNLEITPEVAIITCVVVILLALMFGPINNKD